MNNIDQIPVWLGIFPYLETKQLVQLRLLNKKVLSLTALMVKYWKLSGDQSRKAYESENDFWKRYLGRVHTLYLSHTNVVDVSALGRAHTLHLGYTDVVDVSALRNVHILIDKNGRKYDRCTC